MAVNVEVTDDQNSIDINDVNVFTIHVKDLSDSGTIQITEDSADISGEVIDTTVLVNIIELTTENVSKISVNDIDTNTVTIIATNTNVVEITDNIAIVTAATDAAFKQARGYEGDSAWDQSGTTVYYNDGNVGIGTSSPNSKLEVSGDIQATSFIGTFTGALSSSAQIAADISGAFTTLVSTNESAISANESAISVNESAITGNTTTITVNSTNIDSASLRLASIETMTGSLSASVVINTANIAGNLVLLNTQVQISSSLQSRISNVEIELSNTLVSGSSQLSTEISGAFSDTSESMQSRISNVEAGSTSKSLISGSSQLSAEISGAFTVVSESLQSRISGVEAGSTSKSLISGSNQLATEISGAFASTSESLQYRISNVEGGSTNKTLVSGSSQLATEISGAFAIASESLQSRISNVEGGSTNKTLVSGSSQLATEISGAFASISESISNRTYNLETKVGQSVNITSNVEFVNISASGDISASAIRTQKDVIVGGSLSVESGNIFGLFGAAITIDDISITSGSTQFGSSSLSTHGFTGSVDVTGSISADIASVRGILSVGTHITASGNITASGTIIASNLSGTNTGDQDLSTYALMSSISGSFASISSSIESRISVTELELSNTLISSSNQIGTEISGAYNTISSSLQARISTVETELSNTLISGSAQLSTEISGAFKVTSASLQSRISNVEAGSTSKALISGSGQMATEISGAFSITSGSLQSRLSIVETELSNTLISSSAQISADISGAFNNIDVSYNDGTENNVVVYNSTTKRLHYTSSYGGSGTSATTGGTAIQYASSTHATTVDVTKLVINDYSDILAVSQVGGILHLTFGTPSEPYFDNITDSVFETDRFNREIDDYTLNINYELNGQTFIKGELSESTTGIAEFVDGANIVINSAYPSYQSGSHTFTAKVYTNAADTSPLTIEHVKDLQLDKSTPTNPVISFTNFNITKNAYNESDMEIEEGAIGNVAVNLQEGTVNGWTAANTHNSSYSSNLNISSTGNVTTGIIEEYWNSGTDADPVQFHTGSVNRTFTRVRSLRYKVSATGTTPSESELQNLDNWPGTIVAGTNTQTEIENVVMEFNPSGQFIFIVYDSDLGNLQEIQNTLYSNQDELSGFNSTTIGNYKLYRSRLPKSNLFKYRLIFPN